MISKVAAPPVESLDGELVRQYQREVCTVMQEDWYKALAPAAEIFFLVGGLVQEAGEALEIYKKSMVPPIKPFEESRLIEELGDVLWHVAAIAGVNAVSLEAVIHASMEKFRKRHPHRFEVIEDEDNSN